MNPSSNKPPRQTAAASRLFVPAGTACGRRDVADLMRAMLRLSQRHKLWQTHHALMVETMIGTRDILSIGGKTAADLPEGMGGLGYLRSVLNRPLLFPLLGAAVGRAQAGEHR